MRARKKSMTETFDEYRNAVLKLSENLRTPLSELELVEILQRGLRPRIRQQLLYVQINSLAQLRVLSLKGESLLTEISKPIFLNAPNNARNNFSRRQVNEIDALDDTDEENVSQVELHTEVDEITRRMSNYKLICWNCRQEGHRYVDCVQERSIFCYGCGLVGIYKPNCIACRSKNSNASEGSQQNPRKN